MTRPQMIRADTHDLQNHQSPSAQDHSRKATLSPVTDGHHGSHQGQSLRKVEQEAHDEMAKGPLGSDGNPQIYSHRDGLEVYREHDEADGGKSNGLANGDMSHETRNGSSTEDEMDGEDDDQDLDDDMMDKISSSPSIDDEDIDFEFVYALHTFIATVEGQANATKGDTMVLLDDSNSYWWLVRVVKDGSIGYLPAEHIETPTERLARLNKHRNIDLSATMLGDNAEKSKNPLRIAMRRRHGKTVTFNDPLCFEAEEVPIDYSTGSEEEEDRFLEDDDEEEEEEEEEEEDDEVHEKSARANKQQQEASRKDDDMAVEPLRPKQHQKELATLHEDQPEPRESMEDQYNDDLDVPHGRSRNGVVRNTDSFFKDDTLETKKISLTPNLLRDDSLSTQQSAEQKEARVRGSFESYDKASLSDKGKDDKKRKDKKPGMLSGLFKRRDRKTKATDDDEDQEKVSEESIRSITPTSTTSDFGKEGSKPQTTLQRTPSKFQKPPPGEVQATTTKNEHAQAVARQETAATQSPTGAKQHSPAHVQQQQQQQQSQRTQPRSTSAQETRVRSPEVLKPLTNMQDRSPQDRSLQDRQIQDRQIQDRSIQEKPEPNATPIKEPRTSSESPADIAIHPPTTGSQHQYASTQASNYSAPPNKQQANVPQHTDPTHQDRDFSYDDSFEDHNTSSGKDRYATKPTVSPSPTVSPAFSQDPTLEDDRSQAHSVSPSASILPAWNDSGLRAYMDDGSDIRDLLTIVHDKSNVPAAGPDHPLVGSLFREESKALNDMSSRLDDMLNAWLAKSTLAA
ncbi:SH3 domain protein [Arthroderma uncinatum]|uniref:SH3 domain protein n=1 Tax=Arthroderma uncinatum TaxID=74035 RepID=UPI00144AE839|nr:SH3 domain protein [Arthroderma uncinatum]KAF3483658.1 SH3 domain protein [Arthroderma uncinatum]